MKEADYPQEFKDHYRKVQKKEIEQADEPKTAGLITKIGRFVERQKISTVLIAILVLIAVCSIYFYFATPYGNGITGSKSIWRSIYFSVVTFTSLGYGDIAPVYFGKIIAAVEVMLGLMLVAILIGKIASERQMALLTLVYTSEQQYRIVEFTEGAERYAREMNEAIAKYDLGELAVLSKKSANLASAITRYLVLHAKQGDIVAFGNHSSLGKLYQGINMLQEAAFDGIQTEGISAGCWSRFEEIIVITSNNAAILIPHHERMRSLELLALNFEAKKLLEQLNAAKEVGQPVIKFKRKINQEMLEDVYERLGPKPWRQYISKDIASELGVSNAMISECIKQLTSQGRWPEGNQDK